MERYSFLNDYSEGCHPSVLEALQDSNAEQFTPYGEDILSRQAKVLIQNAIGDDTLPIHLVHGGTMANLTIAASTLRSHEAAIAAHTGHIATHETGAIEATGHKVITVQSENGKLTPPDILKAIEDNSLAPHMPKPRLAYISNSTEVGTIYTKAELSALSACCKKHDLLLQMDGARLASALTAPQNDLTLKDLANLTDVFWIGGTKNGALIGEAIAIPNRELARDFAFIIKQHGGLVAKGRLLGAQFQALFTNGLYFNLAHHANVMAARLSDHILNTGYKLSNPTESNQVFPILPDTVIEVLQKHFEFYVWEKHGEATSIIRLVTSWATDETQVERFAETLKQI